MPTEKKDRSLSRPQVAGETDLARLTPRLEPMAAGANKPPESAIGDRISFARKELRLSIEALARYTSFFDAKERKGISASALLRYENGEHEPGAREIRILCDTLNVPPKWIIYGELGNAGEDALEQQLIRALEGYVVSRANEMRMESGATLRKMFSTSPSDQQRHDWLAKAKSGSRAK